MMLYKMEGSTMQRRLSRLRSWLYEYRSASLLLIFALLGQIFYVLEKSLVPKHWMFSELDRLIPFVPVFVIPYLAWFLFIGVGLAVLFFRDRKTFVPTILLLCSGMAIALIIFALFPNGQFLRPRNVGNGPFAWIVVHVVYANDTNTNCCPSLHVMNQLAVYLGLCQSKLLQQRPGVRCVLGIFTVLVCSSTVLIKQHSIIDVAVALALEYPLYRSFFPQPLRTRSRAKHALAEY